MEANLNNNTEQILTSIDDQIALLTQRRDEPRNRHPPTEPLTPANIAALRYPDAGVIILLNAAHAEYLRRAGFNDRIRAQARRQCKQEQIDILEPYRRACNTWMQRNNAWRDAYQHCLQGNALQDEIHIYQRDEQGPQEIGIRVGHLNLNSLLTLDRNGIPEKFDNLQIMLGAFQFDVFVVGEAKIKGVDSARLAIPGYQVVTRLDRDYPSHAENDGGLLVYVSNGINYDVQFSGNRPVRDIYGQNFVSLLQLIDIHLIDANVRIVAVYNPPWGGHVNSMARVENNVVTGGLLHEYQNLNQDVVILGDINIDIRENANQGYQNGFQQLGFHQSIAQPTRPHEDGPEYDTLIDHIYSKRPNGVNGNFVIESGVFPPQQDRALGGVADHKMIYCTLIGI